MAGDTVPSELPDKWAMSIRQPLGVAGIITPWNFPIAIPCWKTMPALVTGNTVVFKPSSDTPHCATLLVELMAEAGFPPGVVNLVTGSGAEVGDAIVDSPDVSVISFTGSSATGKHIADHAGRRLKRVSLELGGKNGVVVLADADLDLATDGILWSAFGTTGQRCTAALARDRRAAGRRAAPRAPRVARPKASVSAQGSTRPSTSARSSTRAPPTRSPPTSTSGAARASSSSVAVAARRWPGRRPLLRADDLRRGPSDGPDRAGGDLRTGPVGHPGRRLRRGDAGPQPDPLRPLVERSSPAT